MPVRPALPEDRPVVERLWPLFQHDLSEWRGLLPGPGGEFRSERLHAAFDEPGWIPYLVVSGALPAGFALVRGVGERARVLSAFFVVRGARRSGLGLGSAREVISRHPGPWQIPFQDDNLPAARFWPRVATALVGDRWTSAHRRQSDLPPDTWISFDTASK
ncbi:GNAT family N-acetyltransferase [Actinocorallia longicatena]